MGSWNGTCAVSQLHVKHGQPVVVFMLAENKDKKTFCFNNAAYDLCPVPFYGEYNDYGAVENCHGFGLNIVVEALRKQLYEFGQGPNEFHDCEVRKNDFNINKLFEADHEDRLGVEYFRRYSSDSHDKQRLEELQADTGLTPSQQFELDRLASKIKKEDNFRRVTHVIIHGDVFDSIMTNWFIEHYVGCGNGNSPDDKDYNRVYFKDIAASIADYVQDEKTKLDKINLITNPELKELKLSMGMYDNGWDSPILAKRWLTDMCRGNTDYAIVYIDEIKRNLINQGDWDGLGKFFKEVLTCGWIDAFMSHTRKLWTKQTGMGSQSEYRDSYILLADTVKEILEKEQKEYDSWDLDDEDEDEDEVVVPDASVTK